MEEDHPAASFTIFVQDECKEGSSYTIVPGFVKRIDSINQAVSLTGGRELPIEAIYAVECEMFDEIEDL